MNEAELVFTEVLKCDRAALYLNRRKILAPGLSRRIASILKRRISGESVYYILGSAEFMGLAFKVDPRVLVPRPETELLVETACGMLSRGGNASPSVLDIGTGSGCIAVALAVNLPSAEITATDISESALCVARENAVLHHVQGRISFIHADLFPSQTTRTYDMILSNPPYIASGVIESLEPEVRGEPLNALDGGPDGLFFYRRIIAAAAGWLTERGLLAMEMGFDQAEAVKGIAEKSGSMRVSGILDDHTGKQRVIVMERA
jgi:release factor glutamine methyltransferase